jgi:flagellar protein FliS
MGQKRGSDLMDEQTAQRAGDIYRENQIRTASREQLLLITYDIGIGACRSAEAAIERGQIEETNTSLKRAQKVVRELMITLNPQAGGAVAEDLMRLYDFMYRSLVEANVRKDKELLASVREMLETLRGTWAEAIEKLQAEAVAEGDLVPFVPSDVRFVRPELSRPVEASLPVAAGGFNLAG